MAAFGALGTLGAWLLRESVDASVGIRLLRRVALRP